ncbi:unnamed protein product, partial [Oppiella nova]
MKPTKAMGIDAVVFIAAQLIGYLVVVAFVNWYLIFPALVLIILILQIRWIYIKTARDLKRFENMARSPIYNHMSTTLSGLATIRAFGTQNMFMNQYYRYQNDHTSTYFIYLTRDFEFWSSRGINGPRPVPLLGTYWQLLLKPFQIVGLDNQRRTYICTQPTLTVSDPELIRDMNIKDFH